MNLCKCGCGEPTTLILVDNATWGYVKGEYRSYRRGHNLRRTELDPSYWNVMDMGFVSPCWIWTKYCNPKGYGQANWLGKRISAHRLTYRLFVGPIPEGLQIDHLCSVRSCVNPEHLEPVTALINNHRSRRTKIPPTERATIRRRWEEGETQRSIAADYGVSFSRIHAIVHQ